MKKKMLMAIAVVISMNSSIASASIDEKIGNSDLKVKCANFMAVPGFNKTTVETTIKMDISWKEICDLYKEYRTTGKNGFSQKLLSIIENKNGFGDLVKNYKYDNAKIIKCLINSNKDCEEVINKFLKEASKNANNNFEVKLRYRVTTINYELEVYSSEVESVELLEIDI